MRCALIAVVASAVAGQVTSPGSPISTELKLGAPPVTKLPVLDVKSALAEALNAPKDKEGGHEFGLDQFLNVSAAHAGVWERQSGDQWVWRYSVQSPDALSLLPVFSEWNMPEGAKFFVYSNDHSDVAGAFTSANNKENGQFAVRPVMGSAVTFEYNGPRLHKDFRLTVDKVIHVYRGFGLGAFGESGSCNINVVCEYGTEWLKEIDSVVILMNTASRGYCSGSMINSVSGGQLFLTAAHCTPGANDIIALKYDSPVCPYPGRDVAKTYSAQGLTTLARLTSSDFHLLRVNEKLPASWNVYLSGWDATSSANGQSPYYDVVGIHHPAADVKKISRSGDGATSSGYGTSAGNTHWWVKTWAKGSNPTETDYGTTEGGSSGSPLYNEDHQIIGQLHGGSASCSYNYDDYYGAVWKSFSNSGESDSLKPWLVGSTGTMIKMDGAYLA